MGLINNYLKQYNKKGAEMPEYDNNNSGAMFKNAEATTENHPVYKGSVEVDRKDYFVAGWVNEIKNGENAGKKYLKLKFTPKEEVMTAEDAVNISKPDHVVETKKTDEIPF